MATSISLIESVARLRGALHGELILPGDASYESARHVWNVAIDRHPAVIVRCVDAQDVQRAIEFGRQNALEIAVRGGSHSFPGFSTCDDGLVIDLSPMKAVTVDATNRTARAEPGVNLGELVDATQARGLGMNTGTASDTGISGITLGSGIGLLMGKFGLMCDSVRSFDVVTADGALLRASASENPDLYWALRGGGGNFGVVTAFDYSLQPLGTVLAGMVAHPLSQARAVLEFYRDFCRDLPDELTVASAIVGALNGTPVIAMLPCYCGDLAEGERLLAPLRKFGRPLLDAVAPIPYRGVLARIDMLVPPGRSYYVKGGGLKTFSDGAIESLLDSAKAITSPFSHVFLIPMHGAVCRVGATETAFPLREEHIEFTFDASWESGAGDSHVQWSRQSCEALQPYSYQEAYVNFLEDAGTARVRTAYGPNYDRLVDVKTRYDPDNVFHLNQNIKPHAR